MATRKYYSEDARHQAQSERALIATLCLVLGLTIGTIIALLFAPEKGSEVRHTLGNTVGDFADKAEDTVKKFAS
ncbi:MAG: hypothetical protein Phog2KO_41870 [Phototrophicaceae bacterium]